MHPKSFSATAMQTAEACLARYKAENIDYARGMSNTAASLGTAVHNALETYVKTVHMDKTAQADLKYLLDLFRLTFMNEFNTFEPSGDDYDDGVEMLKEWFKRTDFDGVQVLSCELKTNFMIPTSIGEIPFNYIWDRFDYLGDGVYKVVDYKTIRWGFPPEDLRKKIQARAYALAAQIQHPDAQKIWVHFDLLRHGGTVGIVFTREENIATWRFLKLLAQKIVDTPDDETPETLNPTCNWCVRKTSCTALTKNVAAGGIFRITDVNDAIDYRAQLEWQKKAIANAIQEIDDQILTLAREADEFDFESAVNRLKITVSNRRAVDAGMVQMVLPPELFAKYGGTSFTMASVDKLLKGNELTIEQKKQLSSLIYQKAGEPSVKIEAKGVIDDD